MKFLNLKFSIFSFVGIIAMYAIIASCTHSTENIDTLNTICFDTEVLPIFQTNCALSKCHSGPDPEEDFLATDYQSIMEKISPNDLSGSKAYKVLTKSGEDRMPPPPYNMLSEEQRTIIAVWIQQGAKETKCNK